MGFFARLDAADRRLQELVDERARSRNRAKTLTPRTLTKTERRHIAELFARLCERFAVSAVEIVVDQYGDGVFVGLTIDGVPLWNLFVNPFLGEPYAAEHAASWFEREIERRKTWPAETLAEPDTAEAAADAG